MNGHIYVADGSLTEENGDPAWFFWVNVPRTVSGGAERLRSLVRQTVDCAVFGLKARSEHAYLDDTVAIAAYWRTPGPAPLSDWSRFKTVRDVIPTLMLHSRSGATA